MELCKYCNTNMHGNFETLRNKDFNFFYTCPKCQSVYEGTKNKSGWILKSRWFNSSTGKFENEEGYEK